ncbi:MAG: hypothetical protein K2I06_14160, partial [Ruminococcus sp.]|nr:hypothetical protein [Ruminococcus sp.]
NNNIAYFRDYLIVLSYQIIVFSMEIYGLPQQMNGFPQQMNGFPQQVNGFPQQMNGFPQQPNGFPQQINMGNYAEDMKKWKKSFHKHLATEAALTAFFGVLMAGDAVGIGIIIFLIATFYSFVQPSRLLKNKPLLPKPQKNNKFMDFMKVYLPFAGTFWGSLILIAIILSA